MGGGDKCLRPLGGMPILDHVIARLAPQCDGLVLNANGDPERFAPRRLTVVADTLAGYPGPLAGLLAAMDWCAAEHPGLEWIVTAPADCPFLPPDLVRGLAAGRAGGSDAGAVVAASDGRRHPVVGLWHVGLRDDLRAQLAAGLRAVGQWASRHDPQVVAWPVGEVDPFFNVNTEEDLAAAEARLAYREAM